MDESNPELEAFRQQWRAEVSAKATNDNTRLNQQLPFASPSKPSRKKPTPTRLPAEKIILPSEGDEDYAESKPFHDTYANTNAGDTADKIEDSKRSIGSREPQSALEHYEKAVEREAQGSLGDSLSLYRKAFRVSCHLPVYQQL